jgi:hypothetical protein
MILSLVIACLAARTCEDAEVALSALRLTSVTFRGHLRGAASRILEATGGRGSAAHPVVWEPSDRTRRTPGDRHFCRPPFGDLRPSTLSGGREPGVELAMPPAIAIALPRHIISALRGHPSERISSSYSHRSARAGFCAYAPWLDPAPIILGEIMSRL